MPNYKIITDSCCDLTQAQYAELGVPYAPLSVHFGTETHDNFTEPDQLQAFYSRLRAGEYASTSGVNPNGWKKIMVPILKDGHDILCIAFSSGLSTTCQSAMIAAQELREEYPQRTIHVVDSLCLSMAQALMVWHACRLRDNGAPLEEVAAWCEENKLHLCHYVAVDDLELLKRGGRIDANTAFSGGMMQLKPIFTINDHGKFAPPIKARGWKGAMDLIIKRFKEESIGYDNETVCVAHGDNLKQAQILADRLRNECGVKNILLSFVGGTIGAHLGPGTIAAFYLGKHR